MHMLHTGCVLYRHQDLATVYRLMKHLLNFGQAYNCTKLASTVYSAPAKHLTRWALFNLCRGAGRSPILEQGGNLDQEGPMTKPVDSAVAWQGGLHWCDSYTLAQPIHCERSECNPIRLLRSDRAEKAPYQWRKVCGAGFGLPSSSYDTAWKLRRWNLIDIERDCASLFNPSTDVLFRG